MKKFIYSFNERLTEEQNIKLLNRSNNDNSFHQGLFYNLDWWSRETLRFFDNSHSKYLFDSNKLNILSDESTIEKAIIDSAKQQGHQVNRLNNPEMIYRAYNFIKPYNLLPMFDDKLELINQLGLDEYDQEINYLINPYFFGFHLSYQILINSIAFSTYDPTVQSGLIEILKDKYGYKFASIHHFVAQTAMKSIKQIKGSNFDFEDPSFLKCIHSISGIEDYDIFYQYVHVATMANFQKIYKEQVS